MQRICSKDPEPLEKWDSEYRATDDGPVCPQRNPFIRSQQDIGTEDCLRLNVYVPHSVILRFASCNRMCTKIHWPNHSLKEIWQICQFWCSYPEADSYVVRELEAILDQIIFSTMKWFLYRATIVWVLSGF